MLSLSIFSSSQRISVAVYDGFKLKSFVEKEIEFNKIDNIFLLLKKVLKNREKKIKKIFYSVGPGSFTAIRSIKSIAEAISAVYKAEIKTITDFEIYLTRPVKKGKDVIVFFEVTRNKFFYKYFKYQNKSFEPDTSFYSGKLDEVLKFIEERKKNKFFFNLVSNSNKNFKNLKDFSIDRKFVFKPSAKDLANAIFMGFGKENQEIIYYNTYYE